VLAAHEIPDFGQILAIVSSTVEAPRFSEVRTILEEKGTIPAHLETLVESAI